jgi:hypothetical protein
MLLIINFAGRPSVAKFVQLENKAVSLLTLLTGPLAIDSRHLLYYETYS